MSPLPQKRPDPHENVNVNDFSTAHSMSRKDLITMGQIAESRGQVEASMRWKTIAAEKVRVEENQHAVDHMFDAFNPQPMPAHGSQVVSVSDNTPWDQDEQYQELAEVYGKAKATVDGAEPTDPDLMKLRGAVATAHEAMVAREAEVKGGLLATGEWTEMNERQLEAQKTMAQKANQVAEQVK